jgi:large subunit ribosomal protein L7/L12
MALAMNPGSQLTFYHKVFGETHLAGSLVQQLIDKGFKFDMSLYTLKVTGPNEKVKTLSLSLGTTTLMKGGNPSALPEKNKIWTWLHGMGVEQGLIVPAAEAIQQQVAQEQSPLATEFEIEGKKLFDVLLTGVDIDSKLAVIKAIRAITGCGLPEAKALADKAEEGVPVYIIKQVPLDTALTAANKLKDANGAVAIPGHIGVPQTNGAATPGNTLKAKPTAAVVALRNAQAVGQKVKGTSSGSVYVTIAYNPRVKLAARVQGETVSIRAEWQNALEEELDKLKQNGLSMKPDYASMHLEAHGVPVARVIGGFLMGLGLKFDEQIVDLSVLG